MLFLTNLEKFQFLLFITVSQEVAVNDHYNEASSSLIMQHSNLLFGLMIIPAVLLSYISNSANLSDFYSILELPF